MRQLNSVQFTAVANFAACTAVVSVFAVSAAQPCTANDSAYSDLEPGFYDNKFKTSQAACDRALYSKPYQLWLKDMLNGRNDSADKQWSLVLNHAKGAADLRPLLRTTNTRLMFSDEGSDTRSSVEYFEHIITSTRKAVGPDHVFVSNVEDFLSDLYKNQKRWDLAVSHARRVVAIQQKRLGLNNPRLAPYLRDMGEKLTYEGKYDEARTYLKRASTLAKNDESLLRRIGKNEAELNLRVQQKPGVAERKPAAGAKP